MSETRVNCRSRPQKIDKEKWKEYLNTILFFVEKLLPRALTVNYWCEQTIVQAFKTAETCEYILSSADPTLIAQQMKKLQSSLQIVSDENEIFNNYFLLTEASPLLYLNFIQNKPLMKQHGSVDFVNNAANTVMGNERFIAVEKFSKLSLENILYLNGSSFKAQFSRRTGLEIDTSLLCVFISNLKSDSAKKQKVEKLLRTNYRKYFPGIIYMLCLNDCNFKHIILETLSNLLSNLPISWSREFEESIFLSTDLSDRNIIFKACQNTFDHEKSLLKIIIRYVAFLSVSAVVKTTDLWESCEDTNEWTIKSDDVNFNCLKRFFTDLHKADGNPCHLRKYIFHTLFNDNCDKNYEFWCGLFE